MLNFESQSDGPHNKTALIQSSFHLYKRLLELENKVFQIGTEDRPIPVTLRRILQSICEDLEGDHAAFFKVEEETQLLRREISWFTPGQGLETFDRDTRDITFEYGSGIPGRVWFARQVIWIPELKQIEGIKRLHQAEEVGLNSIIAFPITNNDKVLGVLEFFSRAILPPEEALIDTFSILGVQIGTFLARQQSRLDLEALFRCQEVVSELGQNALAGLELDEVMYSATRKIVEVLGVDMCFIYEHRPDDHIFLLRAGEGLKGAVPGKTTVPDDLNSQAGFTMLSNQPVITEDLSKETRFKPSKLLQKNSSVSGISVIIHGRQRPYGVLDVHTIQKRMFKTEEVYFLQSIANIIATAIERKKTEDALRLSRDHLSIILQGVADGITAQAPDGSLIYANNAAARVMGFQSEQALLKTPTQQVMENFAIFDEEGNPFPVDQLPGRLAMKGTPASSTVIRYLYRETGDERWSIVKARPVFNETGKVEFVVNIFQDITELKRVEFSQRLLADAGILISASLDYQTTLNAVAQIVVPQMADWCSIHVIEQDGSISPLAVAHKDPDKVQLAHDYTQRYPPTWEDAPTLANVLRTGQPGFFPNISDEDLVGVAKDAEHLEILRSLGMRSAIMLPLVARGRTLGALTLIWAESGRHYTPADVTLGEELARRCALAIDNVRLYQEAQSLNQELEKRVANRTAQLQTSNKLLLEEIRERKKAQEALLKSETLLQNLFDAAPDAVVLVNDQGTIVRANPQALDLFNYSPKELIGKPVEMLLPQEYHNRHMHHRADYLKDPKLRPMGVGLELFGRKKDGSVFPVDILLSPIKTEEGLLITSSIRDISERKRLETELAELQRLLMESRETDRLELAQELHDGPIQDLYAIMFQLKELDNSIQGLEDREAFTNATHSIQNVIKMLRQVCGELRPPTLVPFGLEKAIRSHMENFRETHPELEIDLDLEPDGQKIPERVRLALFRIYQHAISNVVRHADATRLDIRFKLDPRIIVLEIQDDGKGFDLPQRWIDMAREGHFGLVGTVERVESIGGKLTIKTSPGKGTLVKVVLPNPPAENLVFVRSLPSIIVER